MAIRAGNQSGIKAFFHQYGAALNGVISRIVRDERVAEEALQDTLLKVWTKFDQYDEDKSSLYTWSSHIARNTALDKVRLKRYEMMGKTDPIDPLVYEDEERVAFLKTEGIDVQRLTSDLDEKYKVVLDKMYLQGYSTSSISDELDIPLGTVKTRLRKAISILRGNLSGEKELFYSFSFVIMIIAMLLCL